jgi:hypothetical protein
MLIPQIFRSIPTPRRSRSSFENRFFLFFIVNRCSFVAKAMSLAGLTPEQLATTPASFPPSGIISNLMDPHTEAKAIIITFGGVFMAIMFAFAGVRYYMKFFVERRVTADDVTTLIAILGACMYYGVICWASTVKYGIHMWDISIAHLLSSEFLSVCFRLVFSPLYR